MNSQISNLESEISSRPLPAGWRWVRLGEVCRQDRQIVEPPSDEAGKLAYMSLEHVEAETGRILKAPVDQVEDEGRSTTFRFDERHVLYGKLRPYLNKVALPNAPGRCTTEMIPLLPLDDVDREFLAWLLRRHETVDFAMQGKTGSRMPRADMESLLKLPVPLPPLDEQRRIAAVLREQMAAVEKARAAAQARLEAVKAVPAAFLRRVFPQPGQPLLPGWRWVRLGEVATYWNGRAFKPDEWREEGTPIIRIENLNSAQTTFNYFQGEVRPQNCINNGDLLVSWSASLDAYIWDRGPALLNQHIFKVDEDSSIVLRDFFYYMLRHTMTSIRGRVHGATMQHITKPEFEKIAIPLPPLDAQRRIAGVLREQMAAVEKARVAAEEELSTVNALPAALLRRAFNGEV